MDVWGATVCFNTVEAQKKNIPKPETWKDLTKPVYKGPDRDAQPGVARAPASSTSPRWLSLWGDKDGKGDGWKYMDALHENIAHVHPLGIEAVQHGRRRRVRGRHQLRVPRQHQQGQGARRSTWCSRRKASAGTSRPSASTRAPRRSTPPRSWPTGHRARTRCCCMARTSRSPRSPASPRRWPTCPRTTKRAW